MQTMNKHSLQLTQNVNIALENYHFHNDTVMSHAKYFILLEIFIDYQTVAFVSYTCDSNFPIFKM